MCFKYIRTFTRGYEGSALVPGPVSSSSRAVQPTMVQTIRTHWIKTWGEPWSKWWWMRQHSDAAHINNCNALTQHLDCKGRVWCGWVCACAQVCACVWVEGGGGCSSCWPYLRLARQSFGSLLILSGTFGCHFKPFGYRRGHGGQKRQRFMFGYRGCDAWFIHFIYM